MRYLRLRILLILVFISPFAGSACDVDLLQDVDLLFQSDAVVEGVYERDAEGLFILRIERVLIDGRRMVGRADRLKVHRIYFDPCGDPFTPMVGTPAIYYLQMLGRRWHVVNEHPGHIRSTVNGGLSFAIGDSLFEFSRSEFVQWVPEFAATYSRNTQGTFTPALRGARWNQRVESNSLVEYFESINRNYRISSGTSHGHKATVTSTPDPCSYYAQPPRFLAGTAELSARINREIPFQVDSSFKGTTIYVSFTVGIDSLTRNVEIVHPGDMANLDSSAVQVVENLEPWAPALDGNQPVECNLVLPIRFLHSVD